MANLKEIKNRITSISSTMQITSAMKMVSAAKLKKAQDAITQMRPYSTKLQELLGNLSATTDISENPYSEIRQESNILVLAISSNRGLCGGFNNNKVVVVYNSFVNASIQDVKAEQLLPIAPITNEASSTNVEYIFEPSKTEIIEDLIPKSLKTQFFKALLDSHASEHGARMTAMHKATDNAKELKRNLTLSYNKARQAAITNEILEIVGGAEALKGN